MSTLNNMRTSYLVAAIRRNIANQPSNADLLAEVEKRGKGRSSYADFLREERAAEVAAEQVNKDRITNLEKVLNQDALEAEAFRKEQVLSRPEQDLTEQRLNSYQDKTTDIEGWKNFSNEEWCALALNASEEALLLINPPLTEDELRKTLQYACTNGFYIGSAEAWIRAFKALARIIRECEEI